MNITPLLELITTVMMFIFMAVFVWRVSKLKPPTSFFLVDFVCYKPPFLKPDRTKSLEKQSRVYTSSNDIEKVVIEMVDELLKKTKVKVKDVKVLVCVFKGSSAMSLSSMIGKRYKFNKDITMYDVNGKGCNAGLTAVTLARHLLQVKHDGCALVVSTEEIPEACHVSTDGPTDTPFSEFRPTGAAVLLSNRKFDHPNSKYELMGIHNAYVALPNRPYADPGTEVSITVSDDDDVTSASDKVARSNVIYMLIERKSWSLIKNWKIRYWLDLCHVSGGPMVSALERNPLSPREIEKVSRVMLGWFGYEPISSLWYRLADVEANERKIVKDHCVSQMALWTDWSEFKGDTLVWRAIGDVHRGPKKTKPMLFKLFGDINLGHCFNTYLGKN